MEELSAKKNTPRPSLRWWAAVSALLVTGVLPCPECGAPLALHTWPLLMWLLLARRARQHVEEKTPGESGASDTSGIPPA